MSAYTLPPIDLSQPRDRTVIDGTQAAPVDAVYVAALPAPVSLHFGGGQPIPLEQGKSYEPCPSERNGVFLTNIAAGGLLVLIVSFEE